MLWPVFSLHRPKLYLIPKTVRNRSERIAVEKISILNSFLFIYHRDKNLFKSISRIKDGGIRWKCGKGFIQEASKHLQSYQSP